MSKERDTKNLSPEEIPLPFSSPVTGKESTTEGSVTIGPPSTGEIDMPTTLSKKSDPVITEDTKDEYHSDISSELSDSFSLSDVPALGLFAVTNKELKKQRAKRFGKPKVSFAAVHEEYEHPGSEGYSDDEDGEDDNDTDTPTKYPVPEAAPLKEQYSKKRHCWAGYELPLRMKEAFEEQVRLAAEEDPDADEAFKFDEELVLKAFKVLTQRAKDKYKTDGSNGFDYPGRGRSSIPKPVWYNNNNERAKDKYKTDGSNGFDYPGKGRSSIPKPVWYNNNNDKYPPKPVPISKEVSKSEQPISEEYSNAELILRAEFELHKIRTRITEKDRQTVIENSRKINEISRSKPKPEDKDKNVSKDKYVPLRTFKEPYPKGSMNAFKALALRRSPNYLNHLKGAWEEMSGMDLKDLETRKLSESFFTNEELARIVRLHRKVRRAADGLKFQVILKVAEYLRAPAEANNRFVFDCIPDVATTVFDSKFYLHKLNTQEVGLIVTLNGTEFKDFFLRDASENTYSKDLIGEATSVKDLISEITASGSNVFVTFTYDRPDRVGHGMIAKKSVEDIDPDLFKLEMEVSIMSGKSKPKFKAHEPVEVKDGGHEVKNPPTAKVKNPPTAKEENPQMTKYEGLPMAKDDTPSLEYGPENLPDKDEKVPVELE